MEASRPVEEEEEEPSLLLLAGAGWTRLSQGRGRHLGCGTVPAVGRKIIMCCTLSKCLLKVTAILEIEKKKREERIVMATTSTVSKLKGQNANLKTEDGFPQDWWAVDDINSTNDLSMMPKPDGLPVGKRSKALVQGAALVGGRAAPADHPVQAFAPVCRQMVNHSPPQ